MSKLLKLSIIMLFALVAVLPTSAQGDLSDEEIALLEKVIAAVQAIDTHDTYMLHSVETSNNGSTIQSGDQIYETAEQETFDGTASIIRGDNKNILTLIHTETSGSDSEGAEYLYTITAEARFVDGVLYVNATREGESTAELDPMPDGWAIIEDLLGWPALDSLQLDDLLEDKEDDVFDYPDILIAATSSVTSETGTDENGNPVERITITLDADGLKYMVQEMSLILEGEEGQSTTTLFNLADDTSTMSSTITLDAEGNAIRRDARTNFIWTAADMTVLNPNVPAGTTLTGFMELTLMTEISGINEPLEPTTVPEM
ncbi:MAG: hypothetical protein JXJ20_08320 [Anaerolineae bacterium]|nr:hypothetical protein [Anaerolineae bacterium]